MKKLKIFLVLIFLFFGGLFFLNEVQAADCVKEDDIKCYEVTSASGTDVSDIQFKTTPPSINLTSNDANYLWRFREKISSNQLFVCLFSQSNIPTGVNDTDNYGMCVKQNNEDQTFSYSCVLGSSGNKKTVTTCNYGSGTSTPPTAEELKELNKSSSKVTCNVDCKIGGFFKNTRKECICCGLCTPDDLMTVANTILAWLFGIVGALGLAMFVYGGFLWVISRGDSGSIGKGKDVIKNTVIGMVIMFASGTMIMALQTALNVDKSARVEITGKTQFGGSSGGASDDASDAEHGDKNVGDACKTLDGEDSECKSGAYCYSASKTKGSSGVCVPITKNRGDVKEGGECFYMPHTDTPSMCAEGQCVTGKSNPVVGDKGECKKTGADSSTNLPIGSQCTRLAGSASQCESGAECWNASGKINSSGKCLPESGRNKDYGEDCYLLQGANDCKSPYYCIVSGMLSGWSLGDSKTALRGDPGTCLYQYHSRSAGESCKEGFECSSGDCSGETCQ